MTDKNLDRRTILKAAAAAGVAQVASPFVISARAAENVKIGFDNPFTGTYAELGKNEQIGALLAIDEINAKGGILGRKVELLSEDSTSADTGTAVQKARKLIQRDKVDFLLGNVNSAMSVAMGELSNELRTLQIVTGGHTDAVTGTDCHWNVFRVCNTTRMETNSISKVLFEKYGKKWYFITPDYAFGHTLQIGLRSQPEEIRRHRGRRVADARSAPPTSRPYLIQAQAANPDVILFLTAGQDAVNSLKQAVQFGLDKRFHIAGAQQELEVLNGLPPEARIGSWVFEWYWNQPNIKGLPEFIAAIRKRTGGKVPTARHWFGYAATWTCALIANEKKTLDAPTLAKGLEGFTLPEEIALMPNKTYYRAGDHQLMPTLYVGHAVSKGVKDPEDLFVVDQLVKGDDAAPSVAETGCHVKWPA